jgi:hypothetical protein
VCDEVDEELVGFQGVGGTLSRQDGVLPHCDGFGSGWGVAAGKGDQAGGQAAGHPAGSRAMSWDRPRDLGDEVKPAQGVEPVEAGGGGVEQDRGELVGGQGGVVVEEEGDDTVAGLEAV